MFIYLTVLSGLFFYLFPPIGFENDLTMFARIIYVGALHWMVGLYDYSLLVN